MIKATLFLLLIFFSFDSLYAQSELEVLNALEKISSMNELERLQKLHPSWYISKSITPEIGVHKDSRLLNAKDGSFVTEQDSEDTPKFIHKVIRHSTVEMCRVQYIFIDGRFKTIDEIDIIRNQIISDFDEGKDFTSLVKMYSDTPQNDGILEWFYKGVMVDEFDSVARRLKKGEVAKADVPENLWYFVVLKLEDNKTVASAESIFIKIVD